MKTVVLKSKQNLEVKLDNLIEESIESNETYIKLYVHQSLFQEVKTVVSDSSLNKVVYGTESIYQFKGAVSIELKSINEYL